MTSSAEAVTSHFRAQNSAVYVWSLWWFFPYFGYCIYNARSSVKSASPSIDCTNPPYFYRPSGTDQISNNIQMASLFLLYSICNFLVAKKVSDLRLLLFIIVLVTGTDNRQYRIDYRNKPVSTGLSIFTKSVGVAYAVVFILDIFTPLVSGDSMNRVIFSLSHIRICKFSFFHWF